MHQPFSSCGQGSCKHYMRHTASSKAQRHPRAKDSFDCSCESPCAHECHAKILAEGSKGKHRQTRSEIPSVFRRNGKSKTPVTQNNRNFSQEPFEKKTLRQDLQSRTNTYTTKHQSLVKRKSRRTQSAQSDARSIGDSVLGYDHRRKHATRYLHQRHVSLTSSDMMTPETTSIKQTSPDPPTTASPVVINNRVSAFASDPRRQKAMKKKRTTPCTKAKTTALTKHSAAKEKALHISSHQRPLSPRVKAKSKNASKSHASPQRDTAAMVLSILYRMNNPNKQVHDIFDIVAAVNRKRLLEKDGFRFDGEGRMADKSILSLLRELFKRCGEHRLPSLLEIVQRRAFSVAFPLIVLRLATQLPSIFATIVAVARGSWRPGTVTDDIFFIDTLSNFLLPSSSS